MAAKLGLSIAGAQPDSIDPTREKEANKAKSRIFKVIGPFQDTSASLPLMLANYRLDPD